MADRNYKMFVREGSSPRVDLQTVVDGRHCGWKEFKTLDDANSHVTRTKEWDSVNGHTSASSIIFPDGSSRKEIPAGFCPICTKDLEGSYCFECRTTVVG